MNNIVLQPHGLGDHIFCQQLIKEIANGPVSWPVLPHFIQGLKSAYPDINWMPTGVIAPHYEPIKKDCVLNGNRIIPIRYADTIQKVPYKFCMRAKYDMYGLDYRDWRKAWYIRNPEKENLLIGLLGLDISKPYRLINSVFKSNFEQSVNIPETKEIDNLEVTVVPGFSLFDWSKIIENATEIHTVGTSINFVIELLDIKAKAVDLYVRKPDEKDFKNYDYLLEKHNYNFHL